jgi:hypothetical protein
MPALITNQLYRPSVVLPMVALMQVMVAQDFNLGQVGWVVATRGAQAALQTQSGAIHTHRPAPAPRRGENRSQAGARTSQRATETTRRGDKGNARRWG